MKILKVKALSGYKMLEEGFEINFLTKTRVDKDAPGDELIYLEENLPYPLQTILVGKNSSGKTTALELIDICLSLLKYGRIPKDTLFGENELSLEILYHDNGKVYRYKGRFVNDSANPSFLLIEEESLEVSKLKPTHKKDLSNVSYSLVKGFVSNKGGDTSNIVKFNKSGASFFINDSKEFDGIFKLLFSPSAQLFLSSSMDKLIHLFDDSIEYIRPFVKDGESGNAFLFKRIGKSEITVTEDFLESHLSEGTKRGLLLYGLSIIAFTMGGHVIVDEIEAHFNRNLIANLILMFNDRSINKKGASLIYSTHYSELLDESGRCDNINVLHRDGNKISIMNMHSDYKTRTDMLKSSLFDQNAFDNLLNYDRLMELKGELRKS